MSTSEPPVPGNPNTDRANNDVVPSDTWQRVHPISPMVRGWIAILAVLYFAGRDQVEGIFTGDNEEIPAEAWLWIAGIAVSVIVIFLTAFYLSWRFTRYQVSAEHVKVHSGVLFRQQRQARLDRVQAIDIIQPFLARIFGLAELKFEVADAGESAVRLAYLKLADARALRATILARASGEDFGSQAPGTEHPEAPEYPVLAVSAGRVLGSALLSGATIALVLAVVIIVGFSVIIREPLAITAVLPLLLGVAASYWSIFSNSFNFRASMSENGVRIRYGLLDTRTQTIPPGRVQAVGITQSPLWRFPGWFKVSINVAGYGASSSGESSGRSTLLPVGTREDVLAMLALVLPDPGTADPAALFGAGMEGKAGSKGGHDDSGFTTAPRRARWVSPWEWRRNGFAVTDTALLARSGAFWRSLAVVPHERTQSMALEQGPLSRRLRVSDLVLHTTPGPVSPRIQQIDNRVALDLFDRQSARAAEARKRSTGDRWREHRSAAPPAEQQPVDAALDGAATRTTEESVDE